MCEDEKEMTFEFAPREQILFVERMGDVFLDKVLNVQGALVSDETRLWDFADAFSEPESELTQPPPQTKGNTRLYREYYPRIETCSLTHYLHDDSLKYS